jgi:hypothetical protein
MPKAKNPISEEERSKRFEEEVRRRKDAGDFDLDAAEDALDKLVRRSSTRAASSRGGA